LVEVIRAGKLGVVSIISLGLRDYNVAVVDTGWGGFLLASSSQDLLLKSARSCGLDANE
jgi:hypothetical protein